MRLQLKREDRIVFLRSVFSSLAHVRVEGAANMPASGGAVLVCNHTDLSDGLIQLLYTPRPLVFLAKSELFEVTGGLKLSEALGQNDFFKQLPNDLLADTLNLAGQFIQDVDAVPIIRGYRGTTRKEAASYYSELARSVIERLKKGEVVAIYPEGTRSKGALLPFKGFAARVAIEAGVPVIPSALSGNAGLGDPAGWGRSVVRSVIYRIGRPVGPEDFPKTEGKAAVKLLTERIRNSVLELLA